MFSEFCSKQMSTTSVLVNCSQWSAGKIPLWWRFSLEMYETGNNNHYSSKCILYIILRYTHTKADAKDLCIIKMLTQLPIIQCISFLMRQYSLYVSRNLHNNSPPPALAFSMLSLSMISIPFFGGGGVGNCPNQIWNLSFHRGGGGKEVNLRNRTITVEEVLVVSIPIPRSGLKTQTKGWVGNNQNRSPRSWFLF